jgi:hypothetical protein
LSPMAARCKIEMDCRRATRSSSVAVVWRDR